MEQLAAAAPAAAVLTTQPLLPPASGHFRGLMRAAEHQALQEQRQRANALDHTVCCQLAQSESRLLVDMETAMCEVAANPGSRRSSSSDGGPPPSGGASARELLRGPLDDISTSVRNMMGSYFDDEAASIKRALAGLASDLCAVHEQEARRARDSISHVKAQFDTRLQVVRRAHNEQLRQAKEDLRRECEAKVAAAKAAQVEAEAVAASASAANPAFDIAAWRHEQASLRVKVDLLSTQMAEVTAEDAATIRRLND
jgi:hypothetical protein